MQVLVFCACAGVMLYGISAGIRSDIGILLNPIVHSSGQSYEDVSFAIAIMQLMFGASQPFFGILSMRRSNRLVLMIGTFLDESMILFSFSTHTYSKDDNAYLLKHLNRYFIVKNALHSSFIYSLLSYCICIVKSNYPTIANDRYVTKKSVYRHTSNDTPTSYHSAFYRFFL